MLTAQILSHSAMRSLGATNAEKTVLGPGLDDATTMAKHQVDSRIPSPQTPAELGQTMLGRPEKTLGTVPLLSWTQLR